MIIQISRNFTDFSITLQFSNNFEAKAPESPVHHEELFPLAGSALQPHSNVLHFTKCLILIEF